MGYVDKPGDTYISRGDTYTHTHIEMYITHTHTNSGLYAQAQADSRCKTHFSVSERKRGKRKKASGRRNTDVVRRVRHESIGSDTHQIVRTDTRSDSL